MSKRRSVPREMSPHEITVLVGMERGSGIYNPKSDKGKRTARKLQKRGYIGVGDETGVLLTKAGVERHRKNGWRTYFWITRKGARKARGLWAERTGKKKQVARAVKALRPQAKRRAKRAREAQQFNKLSEKEQARRLNAALKGK